MQWQLYPKMNSNLYLKDPHETRLGRDIITKGIFLIRGLGFELFTFKKLAGEIGSTEATVYRYFENKHKLLNYIVCWYWDWLAYQVKFNTKNISEPKRKIKIIIQLLTWQLDTHSVMGEDINLNELHEIIISESSKVYLTKHVFKDNEEGLFRPYKNLCGNISELFQEYNPRYKYPNSLSSTIIEMAHYQDFFMHHLPSLTDFAGQETNTGIQGFLDSLIFSALDD